MKEYNEETHVAISRETFDRFKTMGDDFLTYKKTLREKEELLAAYKLNFELITYCITSFTGTFGLNNPEGTMIRQSILDGDESPMGAVMKNITGLMTDAMMAETSPEKKKRMEEKFKFFLYLPVVAKFYAYQQANVKIQYEPSTIAELPEIVKLNLLKP